MGEEERNSCWPSRKRRCTHKIGKRRFWIFDIF